MKNNDFVIDFNWLPKDFGSKEEKATFADLSLAFSGFLATEVEDRLAKTVRNSFRTSAYHLAYWFAENWWRLRWEPERSSDDWQMSHKMASIGGGYIWPNLCIFSDGDFIFIKASKSSIDNNDPIRFISDFISFIPAGSFFRDLDKFVTSVIERLSQSNLSDTNLHRLWADITSERSNDEASRWRKREAILGIDPDSGATEIIQAMNETEHTFGKASIEEVAAAEGNETIATIKALHQQVKTSPKIKIPKFLSLREELVKSVRQDMLPWEKGEAVAKIVREKLGLGVFPVDNQKLSDLFSISSADIEATHDPGTFKMAAGFRDSQATDVMNVSLHRRPRASRRFALLRLIGDHLLYRNDDKILPVTETKTARQKFQRAFAQEFLCPFDHLNNFFKDEKITDDTIEDIALQYDVSPLMVRSTLKNKGVIERDA